jgi:hypothetical protein
LLGPGRGRQAVRSEPGGGSATSARWRPADAAHPERALTFLPPTVPAKPATVRPGLYVAGDHRATPSLQGALERAARRAVGRPVEGRAVTDAVSRLLAGPVDDAWRAAAAGLPPADGARLLAGLDALPRGPAASRAFAIDAYLALPHALDPRAAGAAGRWAFLFDAAGGQARLEAPLRRALELGLPAGELTWTAKAVLAQHLDVEGRGDEAEALLREVLVAARGSGTRVERGTLANLVWMCLNRGREAEALVLARYTLERMVAAKDTWGEAMLLDQLAHLYGWGHAWDEVRKVAEGLAALEGRADPSWRAKVVVMRERHLARIAHAAGGIDDALAALDRAEAGVVRAVEPGVFRGIAHARPHAA